MTSHRYLATFTPMNRRCFPFNRPTFIRQRWRIGCHWNSEAGAASMQDIRGVSCANYLWGSFLFPLQISLNKKGRSISVAAPINGLLPRGQNGNPFVHLWGFEAPSLGAKGVQGLVNQRWDPRNWIYTECPFHCGPAWNAGPCFFLLEWENQHRPQITWKGISDFLPFVEKADSQDRSSSIDIFLGKKQTKIQI